MGQYKSLEPPPKTGKTPYDDQINDLEQQLKDHDDK